MEGAKHCRVRRHRTEQFALEAQVFDVGTALSASGQHQGRLDQHLAPVMERESLTGRGDAGRERITESQTVGKCAKSMQPDVGDDTGSTGFHNHSKRAGSVHFGSALLVGNSVA